MEIKVERLHGRSWDALRPVQSELGIYPYAPGSVLFSMGATRVLVAVTLQQGVPNFLRGKKSGWLTAEYALLPASTHTRTVRESGNGHRNGRSQEISRLIGRVFRSIVLLDGFGEHTITIDCDVLQADGGTRAASINGVQSALRMAEQLWLQKGILKAPFLREDVRAVSVGLSKGGVPLLDIDYAEDLESGADITFVVTRSNKVVEIQGAAERAPLEWDVYEQMRLVACKGIAELFEQHDERSSL